MKQSCKIYALLAVVVSLALFPFGWLTGLSPLAQAVGAALFSTEAAHAVGHSLIFMAIGVMLLLAFPSLRRRPGRYVALILAVALGQEGFQLLYKGRGVALNDLTDVGIDLVAAGLVLALWYSRLNDERGQTRSFGEGGSHDPASRGRG